MFNKNDIIEIEIIDQGTTERCIGKVDAMLFFVKNAVIGDVVKVKNYEGKQEFCFAKLLEVVSLPLSCRALLPCGKTAVEVSAYFCYC